MLTYGPTISQKTFGFTSCIMGKAWVVIARLVIGYVNTLTYNFCISLLPTWVSIKTISIQCRLSRLSNVHHANVKIWGKFVQGFCPNIVQLQHSPTLCPCDTGTITKCLFSAHNFFSFTFKEWTTKCLIPKCLFAHGFFSLTFKRRLLLNP